VTTFPVVMTKSGAQPTAPADIRAALVALVTASSPGYTANLPGSLIEDIVSTDIAAIALCDAARVDLINSLTPFGANEFVLNQLGQMWGIAPGEPTNTSAYVAIGGPAGQVIAQGFTVSDGSHQYRVLTGGVIGVSGATPLLKVVATTSGSWAVPAGFINQIITSVPGVTLTVTNPQAGTPSQDAETAESYRARVLQAGLVSAQGMTRTLKTLLADINGTATRTISIRNPSAGAWEVLCSGGDPYQIAYAIFTALFDISTLVGSTINVTAITKANPGVVTTDITHGLVTGQANVFLTGVGGMTASNGGPYVVTVIDTHRFSFGVDTTGFGTFTSGGVVTPNGRNVPVSINDYPNSYTIPVVIPLVQNVTISLTWNTTSTFLVSSAAVAQLGSPALVNYVNSLPTGTPMNLFELQDVFRASIISLIPPQLLTRMVFSVNIDGVGVSPSAGTGIIAGDPESYFLTSSAGVSIVQG
jgi:hypothetical protein